MAISKTVSKKTFTNVTAKKRPFVGLKNPVCGQTSDDTAFLRDLFETVSQPKPDKVSHPQYHKIIGPFKTKKAAQAMVKHGPKVLNSVSAAENYIKEQNVA